MNEEFAIKLKTVLDEGSVGLVRQQIQTLKNEITESISEATSAASNAKEGIGFDPEDLANANQYSARIAYIIAQINDLTEQVRMIDLGQAEGDVLKLEARIEQLREQLAKLIGESKEGTVVISKTTVTIKNNFKDAFKSASKFVLALVGVRGIYSAIRKSMSAYLAQNEELQAKLNGCWYALGSLFAPVLEWIIDKFVYLVSLVDAFVRSLGFAGVNMSKYGKAAGKAAKESKQLAGFDELNNLNENDSSGGGGGSGMNLKPVSDEALSAFKSILALVGAIGAGIAAWKVASALNDLFGWGLNPTQLAGIGVAVGGIVLAISSLLNYLKDPTWLNFGGIITGIGAAIAGVGMIIGSTPVIVAGVVVAILGILAAFWPQISGFLDKCIAGVDSAIEWIHQNLTTKFGVIGTLIGAWIETVLTIIKGFITTAKEFLDDLFNGVRSILDGIISIFRGDFKGGITQILNGIAQLIRGSLNTIRNLIDTLFNAIKTLVGNLFSWVSSKTSNSIRNIINNFIINPINKVIGWINAEQTPSRHADNAG